MLSNLQLHRRLYVTQYVTTSHDCSQYAIVQHGPDDVFPDGRELRGAGKSANGDQRALG